MTKLLIGAGGWSYFHVPGLRPLKAYSGAFDFVEVNSTFYEIPKIEQVRSWRKRVPADFEFAVRCHRDVTHKYELEPNEESLKTFGNMIDVCSTLRSRFLVLETPSKIKFDSKKVESMKTFFNSIDPRGIKLVWEVRRRKGEPVSRSLEKLIAEHDIVRSVDLSREAPAAKSNVLYSRVFGKGQHNVYQFTDEELKDIDRKINRSGSETSIISFHNVRMYKDAARFKIYKETNKFPIVTGKTGRQSLRKVLMEDARFPMTKRELLKTQGWKVIDLTENKRVHASTLFETLPDEEFLSIDEILDNLRPN